MTNVVPFPLGDGLDESLFESAIDVLNNHLAVALEQPSIQEFSPGAVAIALIIASYKTFAVACEDPAFLGPEAVAQFASGELSKEQVFLNLGGFATEFCIVE